MASVSIDRQMEDGDQKTEESKDDIGLALSCAIIRIVVITFE